MAMNRYRSFTTAVLSAAFAFGGLGVALAHHGNVSEHSTTKGKSLAQIERMEREITADLNRKQAMQGAQLAMIMPTPMTESAPEPMQDQQTNAIPIDEQSDDQALVMEETMELAAAEEVEEQDAPN